MKLIDQIDIAQILAEKEQKPIMFLEISNGGSNSRLVEELPFITQDSCDSLIANNFVFVALDEESASEIRRHLEKARIEHAGSCLNWAATIVTPSSEGETRTIFVQSRDWNGYAPEDEFAI